MQKIKSKVNLIWFRNDLRVRDNEVLREACEDDANVIGVYCIEPSWFQRGRFGFKKMEKFRAKFLLESLTDLKVNLSKLNIDLLVHFESAKDVIPSICAEYQVSNIYLQKEWTQEEVDLVKAVRSKISSSVSWRSFYNQFLYHPEDIPFKCSDTPQVFTAFRKKLEKYIDIRGERDIQKLSGANRIVNNTQIPTLEDVGFDTLEQPSKSAFPFLGGETEGLKRLHHYFFATKKLGFYKKTRNGLVGLDYSSKFSPWLANGSISAKTIYWEVKRFESEHYKNQSTYWLIFELIWRDYFKYISLKHQSQIFKLDGILNKSYDWSSNQNQINKWINGQTRSDFVNANMIELKETGWMSNRGRQNVASFFAKELHLDWRIGAAYFEALLFDYDVHSNYGNWMYVSGVGNDPRDRKFNVDLQAERYDKDGRYRKLWLQTELF